MGIFNTIKSMMGTGADANFQTMIAEGAMILDVRTPSEFKSGHIRGAKNLPLADLSKKIKELNPDQTIITCCASGMRSAQAVSILKSNGFKRVYNGGGWNQLQRQIGERSA